MSVLLLTYSVSSLLTRTPGDRDLGAAAPQHGGSFGGRVVPALRGCGSALSADPAAGPLCREDQQPEEFARGRERLQLRHGRSAGGRAPVSAGYPTLQGQSMYGPRIRSSWVPPVCHFHLGLNRLQKPHRFLYFKSFCFFGAAGGEYSRGPPADGRSEQPTVPAAHPGWLAAAGRPHDSG